MTVHVKCKKCHKSPSLMAESISHQNDNVSENRTSRRAEDSAFDFQKHNLFCGEEVSVKLFTRIAAVQFIIPQLDTQNVIEIGEVFLKHLFGGKEINSLDDLQYIRYNKEVTKTLSSKFNLATLPLTSAAASQHSFRVYFQVQQWLGSNLDPAEWRWFMKLVV
ncbi:hypothetical protein AVEN_1339-1 [Araneus ventricosus]|uniref:Uncharacterized protein n=1 Tax=Araneus ventricosus TaxID=182803 RepID=A0A4Y2D4U4_ARAVE|nr:hypothetical protein AVEN_1339-1 [Araneus ventricosus]